MSKNYDPERLARQISDGKPVDWAALSDDAHSRSALALLETIATSFRRQHDAPGSTGIGFWGPLQLLEKLGQGSYGDVYRAFDPVLKRPVALKLPHLAQPRVRQWLEEARRLSRVRHPNVVSVYGAEVHAGQAGIWFELIEGQSLQQWVASQGPLGANEVATIGQTLCAALAAVHKCGLVHGDVKPANILREAGGRLVLVDFGSAREFEQGPARSGSPGYLAPELLTGQPPHPASDLYALAVTLLYLLTGRPAAEIADKALLDLRPDLPPALAACFSRGLSPSPQQRPASAGQWAREIAGSLQPAAPRNRRGLVVTAMAIAVLAAAWAFWPLGSAKEKLMQHIELVTRAPSGEISAVAGPLSVGTALNLRLANSEPLFVYVINEDANGQRFVLYPLTDQPAPLPAGTANLLPGQVNGRWLDWQVSSRSSRERFAVFASSRRLDDLEQLVAGWSRPGVEQLRGVGQLIPTTTGDAPALEMLVETFDQRTGVEAVLLTLPGEAESN